MPLSDQEQRVLEELEAQLAASDPRFASKMGRDLHASDRQRRRVFGFVGVLASLAVMAAAYYFSLTWLVAVGLALLVVSAVFMATQPASASTGQPRTRGPLGGQSKKGRLTSVPTSAYPSSGSTRPTKRTSGTSPFMARLEERWERRRRENQGW